jgi:hypothetical protein
MLSEMAISSVLVVTTILVHYEALRVLSTFVPDLKVAVRVKVLIVVIGCFVAHTMEVWALCRCIPFDL